MPSWPIHLALANKINKNLNLGDEFILGNVMPDILDGYAIDSPSTITKKHETHFRRPGDGHVDITKFLETYKEEMHNPLVLGYLSHIMADNYFNTYTYTHHVSCNNKQKTIILKDGTIIKNYQGKPYLIKQSDFKIFDRKLINENLLPTINMITPNNPIKECPITDKDIQKTILKINNLANEKEKYDKNNYQMFTEEELQQVFDDCYKEILNKLKALK